MEPDTMRRIEAAVEELADREYPRVWIGEEGMAPDEYLASAERNEEGPDWLRVEPGEFVTVEGDDSGAGFRAPTISHAYLDSKWVIENMRDDLDDETEAELHREVLYIYAAKRGEVPVDVAYNVKFSKEDELSPHDRLGIRTAFFADTGDAIAVVFVGKDKKRISVDELTPAEVDESLLEELECYAAGTPYPHVIEDSERARAALERRLEA